MTSNWVGQSPSSPRISRCRTAGGWDAGWTYELALGDLHIKTSLDCNAHERYQDFDAVDLETVCTLEAL